MSNSHSTAEKEGTPYPLTIRGKTYDVKICYLKQDALQFYQDNPRVYSVLHNGAKAPTQEEIEEHLQKMEHVKELKNDIIENGGLIEPLYVKQSTSEVVEGNSRLAAYRLLAQDNAVKWAQVKCVLLPKDVDDSAIASLLGQLHLKGKKDWPPYEQASFLYRRHYRDKVSIDDLKKEVGISDKLILHRIAVIRYMIKQDDDKVGRWSYYDEFLKSIKIQKACKKHADLEDTVVERIKNSGFKNAQELRQKLKVICSARSEKPIKQFVAGSDVADAYKSAQKLGGDHKMVQRLMVFRKWLVEASTRDEVKDSPANLKSQIAFELKQIERVSGKLLKIAK
jgi:hypothetical protein